MNTEFLANAGIEKGSSKTFDTLPYCDPEKVARVSLVKADAGKGIVLEEYDAETLIMQLLSEHLVILNERGYTHTITLLSSFEDGDMVLTDPPNLMRIIDNIFSNLYKYADSEEPIEISVGRTERSATISFRNKIKKNTDGAESNGIGVKTCKRLAEFVLDGFEYKNDGEYYSTVMAIKMNREK